ncbi:hypothetical protein ABRP56_08895 [Pectobacterium odoriferum]|uniref:phage tail fiber protein n=1 Tax=Pectobacterium odoriferum TaxID=78398 RepID=UPI0032EFF3F1
MNVLPNRTIDLFCDVINTTGAKGFVRNAKGSPGFNGIGDIQQSWRSEQRMGSVLDTSNSRWRSFINVLHRGGNDNQETTGGDSHDWGFVFVDDNMTSTSHNFRIIKLRAGVWGNGVDLYHTGNVTADANGYLKTASPVINIYADGSFTTTDEAAGVNVERLSEGVYKITGCQGMHPDAAWNGIDGGVSNPKCRNDKALLWNNYEVDEDGSVTVYTFHRVHSDAMPFAQNRLTLDKAPFDPELGHTPDMEWPDQTPIDVPRGLFIQVRVNMPKRIEPKPAVMSSNVYCSTISPAK